MKGIRVTLTIVLGAALALVSAIAVLEAQDATKVKVGEFMPISGISADVGLSSGPPPT